MFLEVNNKVWITFIPHLRDVLQYVGGGVHLQITNCVHFTIRAIIQKPTSVVLTVLSVFNWVESFYGLVGDYGWCLTIPHSIHAWYISYIYHKNQPNVGK